MKGWKRRAQIFVGLLLAVYVAVGFFFWVTQEQQIFHPIVGTAKTPATLNPPLPFEPVEIPVDEGIQSPSIHGYWVPAGDADSPTVLYLHGRNATIGKNLHHTDCLHQMGCHVLAIDYRGFGKTFGQITPTEASVCDDAETAWHYLTATRGIDPKSIFVYGHSLGGAIAIELATRHPEAGGLVVEGTFTSLKKIARWRQPVTYILPISLLLRHPFDSIGKVKNNSLPPTLFIHGTADAKVPCDMGEQLFAAATVPEKDLFLIDGGQHAFRGTAGRLEYQRKVTEFVNRHLR